MSTPVAYEDFANEEDEWHILLNSPSNVPYTDIPASVNAFPILARCASKAKAELLLAMVQRAFNELGTPDQESLDFIHCIESNEALAKCTDKMYAVYGRGIGFITFSFARDIKPMFVEGNPAKYHCRFRRVENLGQAVVYLLMKGNMEQLRRMGFDWVKTTAHEKEAAAVGDGLVVSLTSRATPSITNDASISVTAVESATRVPLPAPEVLAALPAKSPSTTSIESIILPSGRRKPRCRKCHLYIEGHTEGRCLEALADQTALVTDQFQRLNVERSAIETRSVAVPAVTHSAAASGSAPSRPSARRN
ncbi:uncharacterized protein LAESUDRAFT_762389 [Laetiporus sulphureus 93-53]|uniref:Uncharacterized protein n=1 Tax=Laetiporus sulphureus 93-53 TaxID=1314785 RepID=A0A165CKB5_9APHY|nr:uncharacterized protein LAESUDRAFT_762389 [Laetiporus sulphureus 93-53]KZT02968.1 hypothetical protein LAESUDRAFT_762389 [Laetiporus sulphureus 93-53]